MSSRGAAQKGKPIIDPTSVSSYSHYEAFAMLQAITAILNYAYQHGEITLSVDIYQLTDLLFIEIDDRLTIYYNKLKSKTYTQEEKTRIKQQQEELSDLHDTLVLLNLMEREPRKKSKTLEKFPPIPYDLAIKVKEVWGWEYPTIEESHTDVGYKDFEQSRKEKKDEATREKTLQKALSSIRYDSIPLPRDLAKKVKEVWGWEYPIEDES